VWNAVGADSSEVPDRFDRLNHPGSAREYQAL
jgi:hypothetical protein